jgi:hypothetical protein
MMDMTKFVVTATHMGSGETIVIGKTATAKAAQILVDFYTKMDNEEHVEYEYAKI